MGVRPAIKDRGVTWKKPSRNAPCNCGSGKKFKRCCGDKAREFRPIPISPGLTISAPPRGTVALVVEKDSDLPERLVGMARRACECAGLPDADEYEAVCALLLVNTAAEAVLNRLLEAVAPAREWSGSGKRDALERAKTERKWVRLSELLKMRPHLSRDREPLKAFLATVETRNALVHFKHGQNVELVETPGVPFKWAEHTTVDAGELLRRPPARIIEPGELHGRLTPKAIHGYYESMRALLLHVLDHSPPQLAHVADAIRKALDSGQRGTTGTEI